MRSTSTKTESYKHSINLNSLKLGKYAVDQFSKDITIPKDSKLFRTSANSTLKDGAIYLSTNSKDKNRYITRIGEMYSHEKLNQMVIKSTKDIKIPSESKQMELFIDLLTNNKDFSEEIAYNPYGITEKLYGNRQAATEFAKNRHYENFITKMINYDPSKQDTLSTFANYVQKNGYNGLLDINDIRTTSDSPIIALNKDDLIIDSSKKLNAGMKFVAGLKLSNVKIS